MQKSNVSLSLSLPTSLPPSIALWLARLVAVKGVPPPSRHIT